MVDVAPINSYYNYSHSYQDSPSLPPSLSLTIHLQITNNSQLLQQQSVADCVYILCSCFPLFIHMILIYILITWLVVHHATTLEHRYLLLNQHKLGFLFCWIDSCKQQWILPNKKSLEYTWKIQVGWWVPGNFNSVAGQTVLFEKIFRKVIVTHFGQVH